MLKIHDLAFILVFIALHSRGWQKSPHPQQTNTNLEYVTW